MMTSEAIPFVDLYELLQVPANADLEQLRQRINTLYIEAQNNLEHRNFRKRFYYRELFEAHLPQARHVLLDPASRAEYDRQLVAYQSGQDVGGALSEITDAETDALPPQPMQPSVGEPTADGTTTMVPPSAPATPDQSSHTTPTDFAAVDVTPVPEVRADSVPGATRGVRSATPSYLRMDPVRVERRRDYKRRELIKNELIRAGLTWGLGGGLVALCAATLVLLIVIQLIPELRLGLSQGPFYIVCFLVLVGGFGILCAALVTLRPSAHRGRAIYDVL